MGTKFGAWMTLRPFHKEVKLPVGALGFSMICQPLDNEEKLAGERSTADERYRPFREAVTQPQPLLHRLVNEVDSEYCARCCVVQHISVRCVDDEARGWICADK